MLEFRVLGPVQALLDGRPLLTGTPQQRAVLAVLMVDAGRSVSTDVLVDRVWGETAPPAAASALYAHLARIRRAFAQASPAGHRPLVRRDSGYSLEVGPDAVDLFRFRRAVEGSRVPDLTDEDRVELLRKALGEWRGEPLAGVGGEWSARMRATWSAQRVDALGAWGRAELAVGNPAAVTGVLVEVVEAHPLTEPLVAVLVRAYAALGSPAHALTLVERTRRHLADELGVDPGDELRRAHEELLAADRTRAPGRDRPRPAPRPSRPPGRLVGRDAELRLLQEAAAAGLVVVAGPGGVGKTMLVQHWLSREADRGPDGTLSIDLRGFHPDDDPVAPPDALRRLLVQLGEPPESLPDDLDDLVARYRERTLDRRLVVLLDNVRSSAQARPLLPAGSGSVTVATSRRRLDGLVAGQDARLITVGPLTATDAVDLLSRRDTTVPADRLPELARACGYLPLALTILSAHLGAHPDRVLTADWQHPATAELDLLDVESGDLSIRRLIEATVRTLPDHQRRWVDLLGLWCGEDIEVYAAAALLGQSASAAARFLDLLTDLHVIEERPSGRYGLHDLVAAYCRERAAALPPDLQIAARTRLYRYVLTLLRRVDAIVRPTRDQLPVDTDATLQLPRLYDTEDVTTVLKEDGPMLVAVTREAQRRAHAPYAWQLPYLLRTYFQRRGSISTRLELFQAALRLVPADDPVRHALYNGEGIAQARARRFDLARDCFESALALADSPTAAAMYAENLGTVEFQLGNLDAAEAHYLVALENSEYDDEVGTASTLCNLGQVLVGQGRPDEAVIIFRKALRIADDARDARLAGAILSELGRAYVAQGDTAAALSTFIAARERAEEAADEIVQAEALEGAAGLLPDDAPERRSWRRAAERLYRQIGDPRADQLASTP
jgi:DNA-binding SARP family transcriptional activator/tetratricopeptide (TPR) repeat protein